MQRAIPQSASFPLVQTLRLEVVIQLSLTPILPKNHTNADPICSSKPVSSDNIDPVPQREPAEGKHVSSDNNDPVPQCEPAEAPTSFMAKDPFIIELCAGSARVTACLQQLGMPASFGVDHIKQKNAGRVLVADLDHRSRS